VLKVPAGTVMDSVRSTVMFWCVVVVEDDVTPFVVLLVVDVHAEDQCAATSMGHWMAMHGC